MIIYYLTIPKPFRLSVEDKVRNAKLAIDFKLSQWLPLQDRRKGLTPGGATAAPAAPASTECLAAVTGGR